MRYDATSPQRGLEAQPNRFGTGDRDLLANDDAGESGEATGAAAERGIAGEIVDAAQMRAFATKRADTGCDIGVTFDDARVLAHGAVAWRHLRLRAFDKR